LVPRYVLPYCASSLLYVSWKIISKSCVFSSSVSLAMFLGMFCQHIFVGHFLLQAFLETFSSLFSLTSFASLTSFPQAPNKFSKCFLWQFLFVFLDNFKLSNFFLPPFPWQIFLYGAMLGNVESLSSF